jgi:uncharacterized protein YbaP (TraB family)
MRRQIIVVFLSLFWLACTPASATDRGALFKVTANGHSMLLFGTMHAGRPDFYPLEPRITQALAAAPTLALEIDPGIAPDAAAKAIHDHALARPGSVIPAALAARLARVQRQAGMDPAAMAPYKPWLVATVLVMHEFSALGYRPELAVDAHLAALAHAGNVKVVELESLDAQMAMFSRLSDADQLRFLDETVAQVEAGKQRAEAREVVDAWRTADRAALDAIAERLQKDTSLSARFFQKELLDGRNGAMADKLLQLLRRENNTVAAIGVLHLVGKGSVPALMRAKGAMVERVY